MLEARRVSLAAMLLLPAALVLYFAFNSGGFYPGASAYVAVLLCLVLAVRAALADAPLAGASRLLALAAASLGLYALLTLISGAWSHASGVARVEFDLPLVYLLAMVVCGSIGRTRTRLRWILRTLAAACFVICGAGLISRTLPHVWPIAPTIANNRLSFPVTYWNVQGLVAALGIALCVHLSSDLREPRLSRVLGAGAMPVLASTLLFTFSRGAIATCVIALVAYVLLGRPRGVLSSLIAIAPGTAIAVKTAYDADLLATLNPTGPGAVAQGHHVAVVVAVCTGGTLLLRAVLALTLDEGLKRFALPRHLRRPAAWMGWAAVLLAVVVLAVAFRGTVSREYHAFLRPTVAGNQLDLRARLTDPSNNGRLQQWKVAWRQFKRAPVAGHGAGTYQDAWARYRPNDHLALDAHSLYLEALDELGVFGLVLLLIPIVTILVRVASRIRGRGRQLYAAVFAVLLAWAIHAGVDWDWEMPVVTVMFFSVGGFVLGRRARPVRGRGDPARSDRSAAEGALALSSRLPVRVALGVTFLLLAVVPAFTWVSQQRLDNASYAFFQGDCVAARSAAWSSISVLGNRAEPYEMIAYCDVRLGMPQAALRVVEKAVSLDPENWNYRYDLAVVQAAAGLDPRAAARTALSFDPREPLVRQAWQMFRTGTPPQWEADAQTIVNSFDML